MRCNALHGNETPYGATNRLFGNWNGIPKQCDTALSNGDGDERKNVEVHYNAILAQWGALSINPRRWLTLQKKERKTATKQFNFAVRINFQR